ncbi:MAG TPA: FKBP-type peptidyl-prolyl cis-trans isomerase [Nevskia sp.]|nr:FKBP-type peptidyl-prolyl cis-trans isomerase [Nevskia sp.]
MNRTRFAAALLLALLPFASAPLLAANTQAPTAEELQRLIVRDVQPGSGPGAAVGNMVDVQYTGWLYDAYAPDLHGRQFDSSVGREPFSFMLGVGSVIPGWDRGLLGMKVGGKRTLIIPANLAYGERGAGRDIPPGSILVFDIELLKMR